MVGVLYGALLCAATRGIIFRPPGSLFRLLIGLATSKRPPISDFLFRGGRGLESVGPAKLFDRFEGIFPGKSWGKHLLQRPPTGAKFRQLRLFPYHLKSAGSDTVPVRLRLAAPGWKDAAPFRFRSILPPFPHATHSFGLAWGSFSPSTIAFSGLSMSGMAFRSPRRAGLAARASLEGKGLFHSALAGSGLCLP